VSPRDRDCRQPSVEAPREEEVWGDKCGEKEANCIRIGGLNIGSFPGFKTNAKLQKLHEYIARHEFDIMGFQELNTHWKKRPNGTQIEKLIFGWFTRLRMNVSYFKNYHATDAQQPGGVAQWAIGGIADRATERGEDPEGLGRWTWHRLQGKQGRTLRVVTAYRPVLNREGLKSVWSQQRTYWLEKGVDCCPRRRFGEDLITAVKEWIEAGDQVILLMDVNEDVREGSLTLELAEAGLTELITDKHGHDWPPTFQLGSQPIDGIFATEGLRGCKSGYLQSMSDHVGLWVDIPYEKVFGPGSRPSVLAGGRKLHCRDPRIVDRYHKALIPMLENQNIFNRAEFLFNNRNSLSKRFLEREWNKLDKERVKIILAAEKKCRKFRKGKIQWTPEYADLTATLKAWSLIAAKRRRRRVDTKFFSRILKRANIVDQAGASLEVAEEAIREARKAIKKYAKKSTEKRLCWLDGLAEAMALDELTEEETETPAGERKVEQKQRTIVKQLLATEEQRRSVRIIRRTWGNNQERSGLTQVIGPAENGERETSTEQVGIEQKLLGENKRRFNQSDQTAFMQPPMCNLVDPMGLNEYAQEILDGTACVPEEADEYAKLLIRHMKRDDQAQPMDISLNVEEYRDGWRAMRENTASGISGLHFGPFKAHEKDVLLATLDAVLAQIPFETGFSPERWRQGIEVMLLKLPGNYNVEKLRAILLFEADFNFNNKRWGRILVWYAEAHGLLADEQYSSRKRLAAIDHCLNKRLTFDIIRQNKQPGVLCSNDAKGCYDRIVHSVASICLQRLGMPQGPLKSMFETLQNLEHYVRSSFGVSESSFNAKEVNEVAIQGIGQGNGAGPQIWAAVSTVLLQALRSIGGGGMFTSAITNKTFQFVGYAFVDDTDLVVTGGDNRSSDSTVESMQSALNTWEGCLRASGGAIEPAKTFWYGISFEWQNGNWKYQEGVDKELKVRDPTGELAVLEQVPVSEARRTLGVRLAPDGNDKEQAKFMMGTIRQWTESLRTNNLPRQYAWQSYRTTLWPKIRYALPATCIPGQMCETMDKEIRRALLPAMGINRNLPKALTHGSVSMGGLGLPRIEEEQGIAAVCQILRYLNAPESMTGKLLLTSLEALQVEVGTEQPVLEADYDKFGRLATKSVLKSTWEFISKAKIKVKVSLPVVKTLRRNDKFLIPTFQKEFSTKQLVRLNKCRLAVRAITWADVVTMDGQ
jgi:endonuclease/exonuclease/phosphatase family metal-dependent hydrolase